MQTMKAWQLDGLGGPLTYVDLPVPRLRPGAVLVKVEATALLTYQRDYNEGKLPHYSPPSGPFTIGTNAVGTIAAVGPEVWHLRAGQRVATSPHFTTPENVTDPAQLLIGLTAYGDGKKIQADWRDGTLATYALMPAATVTPIEGLDHVSSAELATVFRCLVPYGGFRRGRLAAGETVIIIGATGAFGGAAVRLATAMGAGKVIAAGRNRDALARIARPRVVTVALTGDVEEDAKQLRGAEPAQLAFDIVGRAQDPNATLAALKALARNGRLVLMGSMSAPLPLTYGDVMINNLEIIGQFMYAPQALAELLALVRSEQLELISPKTFPIAQLPAALDAAATASSLESVVVTI